MSQIQAIDYMLSSINNGQKNHLSSVVIKHSNICMDILNILYEEGYINDFKQKKDLNNQNVIEIKLKYRNNNPAIIQLKTVPKWNVSLRLLNYIDLGLVTYILSTSFGTLSGKEARRLGVGGKILFVVW